MLNGSPYMPAVKLELQAMAKPITCKGEIYEAVFRKQVQFLINAGVYGLAVGGSTGGGHGLSGKEVARLVRVALGEARAGYRRSPASLSIPSARSLSGPRRRRTWARPRCRSLRCIACSGPTTAICWSISELLAGLLRFQL